MAGQCERTRRGKGRGDKNGQNREVPEAGRKIHLSLILGLNGADKSHFGPILGPLGRRCTFLGFKNVDSGLRSMFLCRSRALKK